MQDDDAHFALSDDFDLSRYTDENDLEVGASDLGKAVAAGTLGALEGGTETIEQTQGFLGETAREMGVPETVVKAVNYTPQGLAANYMTFLGEAYSGAKEWVTESLSEDGKKALSTMPVTETPEGNWKWSTDPAVWSMQLAKGIGYMAPTVASAISTGGMSSANALSSLTSLAVRSGAKPSLAPKIAQMTLGMLKKSPTAAVAVGTDVGAQGLQAKEGILNTSFEQLANSDAFRTAFLSIDDDPEFLHLSDEEKLQLARERIADTASRATMTDPLTLGASVAATLVGDVPLANTLVSGSGKGFVKSTAAGIAREGPTEAAQGAAEQYVANQVSNELGGTERVPMDGVALSAVNEGVLGAATGGMIGAASMGRGTEPGGPEAAESATEAPTSGSETPPPAPPEPSLQSRRQSSRQSLREKHVLSDPQDHHLRTLKLAYALDPDKTDALLDRIEQGDEQAEMGIYALAEQASSAGIDETGVQQRFDEAVAKRRAVKDKAQSKAERYIQALEQGRERVMQTLHSPPTYQPYRSPKEPRLQQWAEEEATKAARQFDPALARAELLKREAQAERALSPEEETSQPLTETKTYQRAKAEQQKTRVMENTDAIRQSRRGFSSRPHSMKLREEGKIPLRDMAARMKSARKRLKQKLATANPQLAETLLASLREAPKRLAAFEAEAQKRKAYDDGLPENQARRAQAEALFEDADVSDVPEFQRNAMMRMIDELRARGEAIIQTLPSDEQIMASDTLDAVSTEVQSEFRKMMDEAKTLRTKRLKDFMPTFARKDNVNAASISPTETSSKLEDVGEKIGGARKDIWHAYSSSMQGKDNDEIKSLPLSKVWPQPNYPNMLKAGVSPEALSVFRAIRDMVPVKPRTSYKVTRWATNVSMLRDIALAVIDSTMPTQEAVAELKASPNRDTLGIAGKAALYDAIGHEHSLSDFEVSSGDYSLFEGKRYSPAKTIWTVARKAKGGIYGHWPRTLASGDTQAQAIERFKARFAELRQVPSPKKNTSFDIYTKAGESGFFIGKKVGRTYVDLAGPIEKLAEARKRLTEDHDALSEMLEKAKVIPPLRRETNQPRVGEDIRQGGDVTPEDFANTFGFRGVEFGNWVEQSKRQRMVNDAFDGLMDLAAVLGIPPKAISLNGELGLAFGARGQGGRDPAAAHYEPGRVVINLTKKSGSGSLGHEWWHALDNYFGKLDLGLNRGTNAAIYLTKDANHPNAGREVRAEMRDAFVDLMKTIDQTELRQRSLHLDRKKANDYWSTNIEMSARSFEAYLIAKLADQNAKNDFLANIVTEEGWARYATDAQIAAAYPYPTEQEGMAIRRAFDRLFNSIESKDTGAGRVMLYSRESITSGYRKAKGLPKRNVELGVKQWLRDYKGGAGVNIRVIQTQKEAETLLGQSFPDDTVHAFYHDKSAQVIVVSDNIASMTMLRQKLRHEVLIHHGLKAVVGDSEYQKIAERVFAGRNSKHLKPLWDTVKKNYGSLDLLSQVEEVLAHAAELERSTFQQWWDRVIEAIAHALRRVGLMRPGDMTKAEMNNIVQTLVDRVKSVNHWHTKARSEEGVVRLPKSKLSSAKFSRVPDSAPTVQGKLIQGSTYKQIRLKALAQGFKLAGRVYRNVASGMDINVGRSGIKHTIKGAMPDLASSVPYIDQLIEMAEYLGGKSEAKDNKNVRAHHYFGIKFAVEGRVHDVILDVREMPDGKFYYDHSFERKGDASDGNSSGLRLQTQGPIVPREGAEADDKSIAINKGGEQDFKLSKTVKSFDEVVKSVGEGQTIHERFKVLLSKMGLATKSVAGGRVGLGALTLRQLADISKNTLPMVETYVDIVHRMLTRRNQMAFESAEIAQNIRKWAAKNSATADKMFSIAHDATVAGVDPDTEFVPAEAAIKRRIEYLENVNKGSGKSKAQTDEMRQLRNDLKDEPRRQRRHAHLKLQFNRLPEEAKTHYRAMRDNYAARHQDYRRLLEQQILNAEIDGRIKKKQIAELRTVFDLQEVNAPYFPLTRFGDYWLSSVDQNGEKRYMMFDTEGEQLATANKLREKGYDVSTGYKMDNLNAMNGASLSYVAELIKKVEDTSLNDTKKDEIKDTIYQLYLQALPSRSMRKQFMHRKKVKGWSNDALRSMASNMMKGAYQLARMEYSDELTNLTNEASKTSQQNNSNQAGRYAEELLKRHEWVMNPKHSKAAQTITSIGFVWMLGVSPAAALINTTQNFIVALPMLASRYGVGKASSALANTTKEFISAKGGIKATLRNYEEKDAYQQWHDMGLLDATNAHDLAGMAEAENWQYNEKYDKAMGMVSALFHKAEVFNRETTALATYRLAREKGTNHTRAVKLAADTTWDAHFDYTNANRARYMQSPTMKVITQFKQYSQNMTYYLLRNFYLGFKGASAEEKRVARKQLIGTLGITAILGGVSALPLGMIYSMANALNAVFGDEDEPWDAEIEFKRYLSDAVGEDFADLVIYGAGGAGVSPRISLDGLWIRDPYRDLQGEDLWSHYAQQVAGPVLGGVVLGAIRGTEDIAKGQYWRGIERIVPKFVRDPMKAYRYSEEGALNYKGKPYKEADNFSGYQLLAQTLGFSDHELMSFYEQKRAISKRQRMVLDRRRNLLMAYRIAIHYGDSALVTEARQAIVKFNRVNLNEVIEAKELRKR
ncbi:PLxRFG domain-containing protein [Grimontia hollisae]|uniref:PLxRFG domain-containing protein n=1 Tax=Grimontia hollisae TaxID=673 RepID=UPI001303A517|nr:PLxRFG domain-containing protein [Grimontia hollisae]